MRFHQAHLLETTRAPRHPAKYSRQLIPVFVRMLQGRRRVLDMFAGVGGIFEIEKYVPGCQAFGLEIEPEWCKQHPRTTLGNALALPWPDDSFDAICTSPVYGNRMADNFEAHSGSRYNTYRHYLGRPLHADNAGQLQWGESYREFHRRAWREAARVLQPGGVMVLNSKNHIRGGEIQDVNEWHLDTLLALGFSLVETVYVATPGQRFGANAHLRVDSEMVAQLILRGERSEDLQ